jgi:hypothetical protein
LRVLEVGKFRSLRRPERLGVRMFKRYEGLGRSKILGGKRGQKLLKVKEVGKFGRLGRSENLGGQ